MKFLLDMHVACFLLLFTRTLISSMCFNAHLHNVLVLITVPIYQVCILSAYFILVELKHDLRQDQCKATHVSLSLAWMFFDLNAFYLNILVLMIQLMLQHSVCKTLT